MFIKFQKIIRFVPIVNFFVTGFCLMKVSRDYQFSRFARTVSNFKFVFITFISIILVNIPLMIFQCFFKNELFNLFLTFISVYVTLLVESSLAIRQQEKLISDSEKGEKHLVVSSLVTEQQDKHIPDNDKQGKQSKNDWDF